MESYQLPIGSNISRSDLKTWNKNILPLTVDTEDFITNHALSLNSYLHQQTLFQVVNETFAENWNGTSLFWSEKTFRSIYHLQPFVIFGQHQCNQKLQDYGYKLYTELFDYSFDDERDTYKRWTKLKAQITRQVDHLQQLDPKKAINWKFRFADISVHNLKTMIQEKHTKNVMFDLVKYLKEKRLKLGGFIPERSSFAKQIKAPPKDIFDTFMKSTGEKEMSTTMALVRILTSLLRDKNIASRLVPIIPDEARTFGMEGFFRKIGIYAHEGQKYEPEDSEQLSSYREDKKGQVLEAGITETGAMSSFIAAGTSYTCLLYTSPSPRDQRGSRIRG